MPKIQYKQKIRSEIQDKLFKEWLVRKDEFDVLANLFQNVNFVGVSLVAATNTLI